MTARGTWGATDGVLVRHSVFVKARPTTAFTVFTTQMGTWWPLGTHTISKARSTEVVVEPRVGGRWFERGDGGVECDWGRVLVWEPPGVDGGGGRVVLSWDITADWHADPSLKTEVEVRFSSEDGGTRVELEHRLLERYGERALEMRGVFDSEGGWRGILALFGARVTRE